VYVESKDRAAMALPKHSQNRLEKEHMFQDSLYWTELFSARGIVGAVEAIQ